MTPSISKALLVAGLNTWIMPTIKIGVGLAGLSQVPASEPTNKSHNMHSA
jgi:hypothetical protein